MLILGITADLVWIWSSWSNTGIMSPAPVQYIYSVLQLETLKGCITNSGGVLMQIFCLFVPLVILPVVILTFTKLEFSIVFPYYNWCTACRVPSQEPGLELQLTADLVKVNMKFLEQHRHCVSSFGTVHIFSTKAGDTKGLYPYPTHRGGEWILVVCSTLATTACWILSFTLLRFSSVLSYNRSQSQSSFNSCLHI